MSDVRLVCGAALGAILGGAGLDAGQAQESEAVDHARRVLDLLVHEKFEDVAREFNAQVAAAISTAQLRDGWAALRQQMGTGDDQELSDAEPPVSAGGGQSTPAEYERAAQIPDVVLDDIAGWINKV